MSRPDAAGTIFWLASYPKSGNTWCRLLIEALTGCNLTPISINQIVRVRSHAASRELFDELAGIRAATLPPQLVEQLRPQVYLAAARRATGTEYWKIHDAWRLVAPSVPLAPPAITRGVLYVVRNPLDIAVSLRVHLSLSQDATIDFMADDDATLAPSTSGLATQLPQRLSSWSGHVTSWLEDSGLNVHILRYEDLRAAPLPALRKAAEFLELDTDEAALQAALAATNFEGLRAQELREGFHERHRGVPVFFRRGEAGAWRSELRDAQVQRLLTDHGVVMRSLGYLGARSEILC